MATVHLHPADELAAIRDRIRRLQAREAELREGYLAGRLPTRGAGVRIEIRPQTRAVFLKDRLPPEVRSDPRFWEQRTVLAVTVQPIPAGPESLTPNCPNAPGARRWAPVAPQARSGP